MEDIQTLRKPSNIPPVTLEELNDYSEGNKDQWINSRRYGEPLTKADNFKIKFYILYNTSKLSYKIHWGFAQLSIFNHIICSNS